MAPCFGCLNFAMVLIHIPGDGANEVLQALRVDRGFVRQLTEHQEVVQIVDVVGQGLVAIFDQILGLGMAPPTLIHPWVSVHMHPWPSRQASLFFRGSHFRFSNCFFHRPPSLIGCHYRMREVKMGKMIQCWTLQTFSWETHWEPLFKRGLRQADMVLHGCWTFFCERIERSYICVDFRSNLYPWETV